MKEEWRLLQNGYYEASNLGRIRRCVPGTRTYVGRVLKIQHSNKYPHVILSLGKRKLAQVSVHQLVAEAFLGPRPAGMVVNHKDLSRVNNRAVNLEYVTHRGNIDHAMQHGAYLTGERHPMAKLTNSEVRFIRRTKRTSKELAQQFGLDYNHINCIRRGEVWRHV